MECLDEFVGEMISACSELGRCWEDQIHAVWALGRVGPSARASVPSLIALLEHGTRGVREEALALGCIEFVEEFSPQYVKGVRALVCVIAEKLGHEPRSSAYPTEFRVYGRQRVPHRSPIESCRNLRLLQAGHLRDFRRKELMNLMLGGY